MRVTSKAFKTGNNIPDKYAYNGENVSPPLRITGIPKGAKYLRIKCVDPDAPSDKPWVHWNVIVPSQSRIPENLEEQNPDWLLQSFPNSWGNVGYEGPKPPKGETHRYFFIVKAFDQNKKLLARAKLVGIYKR